MTLNEYQVAADRTSGILTPWNKIRNGRYGLNDEAGECINILKKVKFQGHNFDPAPLLDELGGVPYVLCGMWRRRLPALV